MKKTKLNLWDGLCALVVLLFAVLLLWQPFSSREPGRRVLVTAGEATREYALDEDRIIELESRGVHLVIEILGGAVRVREADCPDLVCLHTGWIKESGDAILCVPAGVRILVAGGDGDVDFVAG